MISYTKIRGGELTIYFEELLEEKKIVESDVESSSLYPRNISTI
jgi:hypothetical protein